MILPQAMDGPRVVGSRRRIGVPELGQKQLATGGVEAAGVSYSSRISTAQLRIFACWGSTTKDCIAGKQSGWDKRRKSFWQLPESGRERHVVMEKGKL